MCKNVKQNVLFEQSEFTFCSFCMCKSRPETKSEDEAPNQRSSGSGPSTSSGTEWKRLLTLDFGLLTFDLIFDVLAHQKLSPSLSKRALGLVLVGVGAPQKACDRRLPEIAPKLVGR